MIEEAPAPLLVGMAEFAMAEHASAAAADTSSVPWTAGSDARQVGRVAELWRYPVKSMRGELRDELSVTPRSALGDRAWALRDPSTGRVASAKRFPRLLEFRATYEVEPTPADPGRIAIEAPDGRVVHPEDARASAVVSEIIGSPLRLESRAREHDVTGIDRATIFGDVPVEEMNTEWTAETLPDHFVLRTGSFFETGPVFLLTSASLVRLQRLQGGTAAFDRRRFRPNVYIESSESGDMCAAGPARGSRRRSHRRGGRRDVGERRWSPDP